MNIKRILLIASPLMVLCAVLGIIGYLWWQTTPYYALQQIGTAAMNSDTETFNKFVDVQNLVSSFTEEVFFEPAKNTPDLTTFQREIGLGAIEMARNPLDRALVRGIQQWVAAPKQRTSCLPSRLMNVPSQLIYATSRPWIELSQPAYASPTYSSSATFPSSPANKPRILSQPQFILSNAESDTIRDFTNTLKTELQSDAGRLKQNTYRRMHEYANAHPEDLINKLFSASAGSRGTLMKEVAAQLGLDPKNFRSINCYESFGSQICDVKFYSPKVANEVSISIELIQQSGEGLLVPLKVSKLVSVKRTLLELGEDSEKQVQALVAYGLQDVTTKNAFSESGNALKRLGQQESTQKLLKQLFRKARQGM